jgi:hypothetical protein
VRLLLLLLLRMFPWGRGHMVLISWLLRILLLLSLMPCRLRPFPRCHTHMRGAPQQHSCPTCPTSCALRGGGPLHRCPRHHTLLRYLLLLLVPLLRLHNAYLL